MLPLDVTLIYYPWVSPWGVTLDHWDAEEPFREYLNAKNLEAALFETPVDFSIGIPSI